VYHATLLVHNRLFPYLFIFCLVDLISQMTWCDWSEKKKKNFSNTLVQVNSCEWIFLPTTRIITVTLSSSPLSLSINHQCWTVNVSNVVNLMFAKMSWFIHIYIYMTYKEPIFVMNLRATIPVCKISIILNIIINFFYFVLYTISMPKYRVINLVRNIICNNTFLVYCDWRLLILLRM